MADGPGGKLILGGCEKATVRDLSLSRCRTSNSKVTGEDENTSCAQHITREYTW